MKLKPLRFKTIPFAHQRKEFMLYRTVKARARFWTMRTGKTKITIDEFAFNYHIGEITGVIIIAPNTVHANWVLKELPTHCPIEYNALIYRASKAKQKGVVAKFKNICLNRDKIQILSINSTSLRTDTAKSYLLTFLKNHKGKVFVVFDEAHDFKKPGSKRTVTARQVSKMCKYKRLLTGTPAHGSPMNLYSEFQLLEEGCLGFTDYEKFKNHYGLWEMAKTRAGRPFVKFLGPQNEEELMTKMAAFTTVLRREDVPGLARPLDIERMFEISDRSRSVYDAFFENPILDDEVVDGGVFFQKLQQISSGFLITKKHGLVELVKPEENPRFDLILNEVTKAQGKVIVWMQYHYEFDTLRKLLEDAKIGFSEVHGRTKEKDHMKTILEFGRSDSKKVIFGHAQSGGVGGDLSYCNTIIWGSHTFNLIDRDQASERGTQIGKLPVDLIDIVGVNTVDSYILDALKRKVNVADEITATGLVELKARLLELSNA